MGFTCAQKEDLVVAIRSRDLVYSYGGVLVIGMRPYHQGLPADRVNGVKHDRMIPHECHNIIWKLFSTLNVGRERATGTLRGRG